MTNGFNPRHFSELDALLRRALALEPPARRELLRDVEAGNPELADHLRNMLAAAEAGEGADPLTALLDAGVWAALADDPAAGHQFGPWRAIGTLAHGGMARVLLAERTDGGYQQHVAIKSLWPGLVSHDLVARFEQERQILARLDDPRIARLLDGGVRADGVPWLALEYVHGCQIVEHCDDRGLDLDARLSLWADVAGAVASAHRQLIVHRDLKPGNVLVTADGAVKLLDFGIAKLLDANTLPHAAPPTRLGGRAMTPGYASPEQLRSEPVATTSDVWQLGLLLHELATGVLPFGAGNQSDLEQRILQQEATPPSAAANQGPDAAQRARARATTPARLGRRLRGDFDAIVLRALAKAANARYPSADALRDDIARWQHGLPVKARRASPLRRGAKWLRRHALLATATCVLALTAGAYVTTTLLQAREIARQASINRNVRDYLVGWFQAADPGGTAGRDPKASEMLASGLARARQTLHEQPDLLAEILGIVGEVYVARGEYTRAEPILREAHAVRRRLPSPDPAYRGSSAAALATLLHYQGAYAESESLFREALRQRLREIGDHAYPTVITRWQLADLLHSRGRYTEAITQLQHALAAAARMPDASPALVTNVQRLLANVYRDSGRLQDARDLYARALAVEQRVHGEMHPNTTATHLSLGRLLLIQGHFEQAAQQIEPAFARFIRIKGNDTPATAYWERLVAELEEARGEFDATRTRLRRLDRTMRAQLPARHLTLGYIAIDHGFVALALGHTDEARKQFRIAEAVFAAIRPQGHPHRVEIRLGQALAARQAGAISESSTLLNQAATDARQLLAPTHPLHAAIAAARAGRVKSSASPTFASLRVRRALARAPDMQKTPAALRKDQ